MSCAIDRLIQQMADWPPVWAYLFLALSAFLENVVPPVPGDTVVVFGAYLVGRGALAWAWVYGATCLGGTLGFVFMWYMGYSRGRTFFEGNQRRARIFSIDQLARVQVWLSRYGLWLVLANRFLSGIRSVIALAAGMAGLGWRPVALLGLVSMAVWNGLLLYLGLLVGRNWFQVTVWLGLYHRAMLIVLVVMIAATVVWRWRRRVARGNAGQVSGADAPDPNSDPRSDPSSDLSPGPDSPLESRPQCR